MDYTLIQAMTIIMDYTLIQAMTIIMDYTLIQANHISSVKFFKHCPGLPFMFLKKFL